MMIYEAIKKALIDQLGIDEAIISPDAQISADLELDSTETVIIALEIKKRFNYDYKFSRKDVSLQEIVNKVEESITEKMSH